MVLLFLTVKHGFELHLMSEREEVVLLLLRERFSTLGNIIFHLLAENQIRRMIPYNLYSQPAARQALSCLNWGEIDEHL